MSKINAIHIVLFIVIFVFHNQQRKIVKKGKIDRCDLVRNSIGDVEISPLIPIILLLIPVYYLLSHAKVNSEIIEKIFIMLTYMFSIRTLQNIINPNINGTINVTIPLVTLILLNGIYSDVIDKQYTKHVYVYILILTLIRVQSNLNETTTSVINDVVLSHLIFYCNK